LFQVNPPGFSNSMSSAKGKEKAEVSNPQQQLSDEERLNCWCKLAEDIRPADGTNVTALDSESKVR
jgi:hypothetical protein